jgi:hypothetical protein
MSYARLSEILLEGVQEVLPAVIGLEGVDGESTSTFLKGGAEEFEAHGDIGF